MRKLQIVYELIIFCRYSTARKCLSTSSVRWYILLGIALNSFVGLYLCFDWQHAVWLFKLKIDAASS